MVTKEKFLSVAELNLSGFRRGGRVYVDKTDVVAWLRRCALESSDEIAIRVASELANGLERTTLRGETWR